jgi:Fe-S cluster assembly protein SufD
MNLAVTKTPAELAYGGILLPHARMEDWRWTNLRTLIDKPYPPRLAVDAAPADIELHLKASPFANVARARLVFVNGFFDKRHSSFPASGDVEFTAKADLSLTGDEPVIAMNRRFATGGGHLKIKSGGNVDAPIEFVFISTRGEPRTIATQLLIEIGERASATIVETHLGEGSYLSNTIVEIRLGNAARLDRVKAEIESPDAIHLAHVHLTFGRAATLHDFTLTTGARVNRQNGTYSFAGEGSDAKISGAYLLSGRQHADTRLVVDHCVPRCTSRELFKCVMDENARGVFQGKVIVERGAQKTDGKQSSHALLLSPTAEFDAKPELEIYADDVVCGHGATSGDIDENHLFYLRSRGITEAEAKSMLIAAFVEEAFESIGHDGIRDALSSLAGNWLVTHKSAGP